METLLGVWPGTEPLRGNAQEDHNENLLTVQIVREEKQRAIFQTPRYERFFNTFTYTYHTHPNPPKPQTGMLLVRIQTTSAYVPSLKNYIFRTVISKDEIQPMKMSLTFGGTGSYLPFYSYVLGGWTPPVVYVLKKWTPPGFYNLKNNPSKKKSTFAKKRSIHSKTARLDHTPLSLKTHARSYGVYETARLDPQKKIYKMKKIAL